MELMITAKNMEISPEVRSYIERKLGKIEHYLPDAAELKVEIFEEKTKSPQQHFVVQVMVNGRGTNLRSEERAADLFTAINRVVAVTNRQITHHKGKRDDRRKVGPPVRNRPDVEGETEQLPAGVVKVKRFAVETMPVEEAIYQMEALGHDFFLFLNDGTGKINLLYRRKDNNYGIIEPEGV
ncbi:MAG: ribosome-associated translation inhibitor RaiA [Dehalococcoidales bacterium]|nr:ribosome-associated translation inhibitor RaiA [Dehalococcoidales bacterium]